MKKISLVFILLLASTFSNHAMAMERRQQQRRYQLHQAAKTGDFDTVQQLIKAGHDVNEEDNYGETPLHYAARNGHLLVVRALLEDPRIEPTVQDSLGWTPLHHAARNGRLLVVRALLEDPRIEPNIKDNYGVTPLHYAAVGIVFGLVFFSLPSRGC